MSTNRRCVVAAQTPALQCTRFKEIVHKILPESNVVVLQIHTPSFSTAWGELEIEISIQFTYRTQNVPIDSMLSLKHPDTM